MFFTGIMGLLFPLWITRVMGGTDATLGFTLSIAMATVFLISPILGTISDQTGRLKSLLVIFTLIFVASGFLIGTPMVEISITLFALGVVAIHTADIFYNALLEDISDQTNMGFIAGLGVGLGYIGAIIAVIISVILIEPLGHLNVIRILSILMLILTLPLMVIAKDRPKSPISGKLNLALATSLAVLQLIAAVKKLKKERSWARFLVARFWYMWAVNGASAFVVLYGIETIGLTDSQVQVVMLIGIVTGIPSGAIWGKLVDKIGASAILKAGVASLFVLLCVTALIPIMGLPNWIWGLVGMLSGVSVSGIYVAERPLVLSMAPPGRIGEYFGLNSMSGRLSAVAGPFSWGFIAVTLGLGQITAVLWLAGCLTVSIITLVGLKIEPPSENKSYLV
jgi:UMF1 family MFS transporter